MNEDKILQKLVEFEERFDRIDERMDQFVSRDEFNTRMDKVVGILERFA